MLAATAMGLAPARSGCIPALQDVEIKIELGIPAQTTAIAAVIVGTPADEVPATTRREPHVLRWIREALPATPVLDALT